MELALRITAPLLLIISFVALAVFLRKYSKLASSFSLSLFSITLALTALELALISGFADEHPLFIRKADRDFHNRLMKKHYEYSGKNDFGFNDRNRTIRKISGSRRVMVLGDSFIWGAGLSNRADVWSRKLETKLHELNQKIEVMHCGQNGWSTLNQLEFLKEHGLKFKPDLILVGFVTNDPDLGDIPQKHFTWERSAPVKLVEFFFRESPHFLSSLLNEFIYKTIEGYGYSWWEEQLYTEENLRNYESVIGELSLVTKAANIPTIIVLTPNNYAEYFDTFYQKIAPLFEEFEFSLLNLLPEVKSSLSHFSLDKLKANPADGHPGPLVTEVYAEAVTTYLKKHYSELLQLNLQDGLEGAAFQSQE